jgi:hypothetical protein
MIKLINIFKVIVEGIQIKDNQYVVDYDKDYSEDLIRFSDNINFTKNNDGDTVMIGFPIEKFNTKSKLVNDLKNMRNMDSNVISFIMSKIANNLNNQVDINSFDYVISPKSSSPLLKTFLDELKNKSDKPIYVNDMFLKNDVENIWLDLDTAKNELSNKYFNKLIKAFDKTKNVEGRPLKLQPLTKFQRKYIRDLLIVNPNHENMLTDMLFKKVLIVDDIITTGKTLNDIKTLLSKLNINGVTLFSMFG